MEVSSDFGELCVTCSVGHVVRDGACAPWTAALCTHETNSADVGRLECANGMTRFVNCDTRAWTTSCAYVDVDTERVGFYADADAVDATCDTENGCASSAAQGTASHTAQGAAVVSARGACGAHCTPSTRRRAMHATWGLSSATRGRGAFHRWDRSNNFHTLWDSLHDTRRRRWNSVSDFSFSWRMNRKQRSRERSSSQNVLAIIQ